jgi:hypothetical protein
MNGDRDHERKEPLPLGLGRSVPEPLDDGSHLEPSLLAFGDEPEVAVDSGLAVPSDLRAAHQSRGSMPVIAIAAFILFCLSAGAYAAWMFSAGAGNPAPAPIATAPASAPPASAQSSSPVIPAPPQAAAPPAAPPIVDRTAERARQAAATARRVAERARQEQEQAEQLRVAALRRHEEKIRAERLRKEAAAHRAQQVRARAEQAVQHRLDEAAPAKEVQPPPSAPHEQNARLLPESQPGDAPPLDAKDLPPPAPGPAQNP